MQRLRPFVESGQDLGATDRDLDREQDSRTDGQADERRVVALGPPRHHRQDHDEEPDQCRHPAMEDVRGGHIGQRRQERAVHQRPVREDECRRRGGHLRSEQQQREGRRGGERSEQREALACAATADPRWIASTDRQEDQKTHERERRREMRGHRLTAVPEPHGLAPEPGLEADEPDGGERRPQDRPPIAMVEERQDREPEDLETDDDGDRAVDPLDPRLGVIQGRDQLAVTERPVGAAQPGIGGAHDHPDRDQPESGREGQRGELLEAVHGPPFYPGGRFRPSAIP